VQTTNERSNFSEPTKTDGEATAGVTVGIVTYNSSATISQTLSSLARQTLPTANWKILFVDHDSKDETPEILARFLSENPNASLVSHKENNISRSRQFILETCQTEWVAFVDSDIILPPNWISAALDMAAQIAGGSAETIDPKIAQTFAGVGGQLRLKPFKSCLQEAALLQTNVLGHFGAEQMMISSEKFRRVSHLPTAAAIFRVATLLNNGGFKGSFGNCGEDLELGERLTGKGLGLWISSELGVDHLLSCETRRAWSRRAFRYGRARVHVATHHPRLFKNYRLWLPVGFATVQLGFLLAGFILEFWVLHFLILCVCFFRFERPIAEILRTAYLAWLTHQAYAWGEFYELVQTVVLRSLATTQAVARRLFRRPVRLQTLAVREIRIDSLK
jgi:succinoglycan biosynthesis protein ExoA